MTAPIDLATDADIAEALRLAAAGAIMGARAAVLLPKMAAHLAAFKVALKPLLETVLAAPPGQWGKVDTLRALCGDGPTDLVLVPAAELARLRGIPRDDDLPDDVETLKNIIRHMDVEIVGAVADYERARSEIKRLRAAPPEAPHTGACASHQEAHPGRCICRPRKTIIDPSGEATS